MRRLLAALEPVPAKLAVLLGSRFTLADAALFGQLAMNLEDPEASDFIARAAPTTTPGCARSTKTTSPATSPAPRWPCTADLAPLFAEIGRTYVPLMQQQMRL